MRALKFSLMLCVILGAMPLAAKTQVQETSGEWHVVKMTARKYQYDPNVITVKQGEKVRLIITALDRDHGFDLKAFGINQRLKKGDPATIEFSADKVGTYEFKCSVFCGFGHGRMKGKLIVEP